MTAIALRSKKPQAESRTSGETLPLHRVAISVKNIATSTKFYEHLGFKNVLFFEPAEKNLKIVHMKLNDFYVTQRTIFPVLVVRIVKELLLNSNIQKF